MSKMYLKYGHDRVCNESGLGLITAIFVIVVVGMFGVLIARYSVVSSVASAEDYFWAQALYSAQSAGQLALLHLDGGGGSNNITQVADFTVTTSAITSGVQATATKSFDNRPIIRVVELRYSL